MGSYTIRSREVLRRLGQVLLGGGYSKVRGDLRAIARGDAPAGRQRRSLLECGLFDSEYYSAQSGTEFINENQAAQHFLKYGMREGAAMHPLVEPEYFPGTVNRSYVNGDIYGFLKYLASKEALDHDWGPLLDPRQLLTPDLDKKTRAVDFLRELQSSTALPVSKRSVTRLSTYGEARHALVDIVAETRRQQLLHTPHRFSSWDFEAESEWLSHWDDVALDENSGPLVSVILPVWNRPVSVIEAIKSVQQQSIGAWELIVVDDGSDDETPSVVQRIADQDPRIRVHRIVRAGVSSARNVGLSNSTAKYVAFLDSDNTWSSGFLRTSLLAMDEKNARAAHAAVRVHNDDGTIAYYGAPVSHEQLLIQNYLDLNTFVAERELLVEVGGFDAAMKRWVDHDLFIRVSARSEIAYFPFIGCEYDNAKNVNRVSNVESINWQYVALGKNLVDWEGLDTSLKDRVPGRVSVIVVAVGSHVSTLTAVKSVLDSSIGEDVEIVVIDNGSRRSMSAVLTAAFAGNDRVQIHRLAMNYNFGIGANIGFARSTGEYLFFMSNDAYVRDGWSAPLREALNEEGVIASQPLIAYRDGSVQSAGIVFSTSGLPTQFLNGHPMDDATRHDGRGLGALSGAAFMIRAASFARLRGFDPIYVNGYEDFDLCLRAARDLGGGVLVKSNSLVVHRDSELAGRYRREVENRRLFQARWLDSLPAPSDREWKKLGFEVPHMMSQTAKAVPLRPLVIRPRRFVAESSTPTLRWAIKIGADFSPGGDRWGDVPFANDLAMALRNTGQEVVVDRFQPTGRPSSYLDDVVIALRGRHAVAPQNGCINIMWVISRPELITVDEIRGFDHVFAASPLWAKHMSELTGVPVHTMLQATNPERFHYARANGERRSDVLFVGGPRPPIGRRIVLDAIGAGMNVHVWGPGWQEFIDDDHILGDFISNDELAPLYANSHIVLNDHFEDMATWGFINNRLFDAVASGAKVVSDYVEGIDELFHGAVQTYHSVEDLTALGQHAGEVFPGDEERRGIADMIIRDHSFEKRAEVFMGTVFGDEL